MNELRSFIKDIILNTNGVFVRRSSYPAELEDIVDIELNDVSFSPASEDKVNLSTDIHHVKSDIKSAVKSYKETFQDK